MAILRGATPWTRESGKIPAGILCCTKGMKKWNPSKRSFRRSGSWAYNWSGFSHENRTITDRISSGLGDMVSAVFIGVVGGLIILGLIASLFDNINFTFF